jgi:hypothetical protein
MAGGASAAAISFGQEPPDVAAQIRADLEKHASFGVKISGGSGDTATANWIRDRLKALGYRVEEFEFDAPFFVKRAARIASGPAAAELFAQSPAVPTSAEGITSPLVVVDNATPAGDPRGKIAVLIAPFARHAALTNAGLGKTIKDLAAAGARAIAVVTTGPSGEAAGLNVPESPPFVPVPFAILAPKLSDPIVDAARGGATATFTLDGDATHRPCKNLVARLERGPRWIVLSTPRSGWSHCVGERGTGTAIFLELAAWAGKTFPDHSIFAMNSGGHEFFFAGSHRIVDQAPKPENVAVWAHIGASPATRDAAERDGKFVMLDTADPQRTLMTTDRARPAATEAFRGLSGLERPTAVRAGAGELSAFTDRGYTAAFAVIATHRWFHTVEDTLERVDAKLVVPVLRAHQRMIELLVHV